MLKGKLITKSFTNQKGFPDSSSTIYGNEFRLVSLKKVF